MKNKRLSLSLFGIVLSGIIIFGGRKYYEPSVSEQAAEDMEVGEKLQEKSLYDAVVISTKNDALENVPSAIACTDLQKIKSATAADADHFWEIPNSKGDFIVYDKKSKVITACYEGKAASAKLPPEMATEGEDQVIRVSPAFFTDLFADGKREFLIFSGQCVEGPCIGSHYLYQVDGAELRKLYKFRSDTVELITEKERRALILDNNCYTYDFGVGFEYLTIAEAKPDGGLEIIPYPEVRTRYPQVLTSERIARTPEDRPEERAQAEVQKLVDEAYRGKPIDELLADYDKILATLPENSSEAPGSRLGLHCDPAAKLKMIAGTAASQ